MASFFEKLIGGQAEEPETQKPVKKTTQPEEEIREKKEVKKPVRKLRSQPRPEPEIQVEEEKIAEKEPEKVAETETKKQEPVQIQAKTELRTKEPAGKKSSEEKNLSSAEGQLAIDVYQNEKEIIIQSTIGGVKPNDLEITIENGIVYIRGSRQRTDAVVKDDYFIQECHWGSFSRQLVLPSEVDSSRAEATLKDGVLTIRMPRIQKEKLTKLEIKE